MLQFWGVARFFEIQRLKLGHLVRRVDRFDLFHPKLKECSQSDRVVPIYPMPLQFEKTFCPVFILSNYLRARHELGNASDDDFLFPKMNSTFEQGTNRQILSMADPVAPIPTASFLKKFKQHVESDDMQKVGVNPLEFTPDSLQLGGKLCLVNGVVYPDFSKPSLASAGSTNPSLPSRKRPSSTIVSSATPELGTSINPKVCVIQATSHFPVLVPAAPTSEREASQGRRVHFDSSNDDLQVSSQPEPEVTPVEPPPVVQPTIWNQINSLGAISVTLMNYFIQGAAASADVVAGDVADAPHPRLPPGIDEIIFR